MAMAPLDGDSYAIDTMQVHMFLVNFVSGNDAAADASKIQGLLQHNDGREAFNCLLCTMKEWGSVPLITGKQMKLSRTCFLQVNSLCTGCGGRNLRSDSHVLSMRTLNARVASFTLIP
jgi:hypothetical protein